MVFTRVDLPAPLSPTRATTSPALTSKSTPSSAWTAPNRLLTPPSASRAPFELIRLFLSSIASPDAPHRVTATQPPDATHGVHLATGCLPPCTPTHTPSCRSATPSRTCP